MSVVRLQFSAQSGIASRLICWFTQSEFSHVDIVAENGDLIGARLRGGVRRRRRDYVAFTKTKAVELSVSDAAGALGRAWLESQIGKPYDTTAIFAFMLARDWRETDSWYCSELAGRLCELTNFFAHPLCVPSSKLTPGALLLAISARQSV